VVGEEPPAFGIALSGPPFLRNVLTGALFRHFKCVGSNMKRAAIGVRMHSGWGALVAVSNSAGTVEVIKRLRVAITTPGTPGANQPYHFAKNLEFPEAQEFLGNCFAASNRLALAAVRDVVDELGGRHYRVVGSAVLLASGRPLPPLSKIFASHALIHAAEGEFFREAFLKACEDLDLAVTGFREGNLDECVKTTFGKAAARMRQQISTLGRPLGPPWTKDQKTAALAALVVLATSKGDSHQSSLRGGLPRRRSWDQVGV
jgi:hypothetical protein